MKILRIALVHPPSATEILAHEQVVVDDDMARDLFESFSRLLKAAVPQRSEPEVSSGT
jgi:hypothetical protein